MTKFVRFDPLLAKIRMEETQRICVEVGNQRVRLEKKNPNQIETVSKITAQYGGCHRRRCNSLKLNGFWRDGFISPLRA